MRAFVVEEPRVGALRALNYSPAVERIRRAGSNSARSLREVVREFGPGWRRAFVRLTCDAGHGVAFLSQGDFLAAEPQGRPIRLESMTDPARYRIQRGQILLAGTGTLGANELYGRAILADGRLDGKYLSEDAMALVLEDDDDDFSLFSYAWLASPTGVEVLRSTSYGTKLLRLRKDLLPTIPIPLAPSDIVSRVAKLVRACTSGRERYFDDLQKARALVESIPEMQVAHEMCAERRWKSVLWDGPLPSLCAWNFASGGGMVRFLKSRWRTTLRDIIEVDGVFNGPRFARVDCSPPHGIDFLSQRDVFLMRPVGRRIARPPIADRQLFVPKDALLVGSHGQMNEGSIFGKVELASFAGWRAGVTQDILRVLVRGGLREVAYAFLSTTVGQWLLKSTAVGTSIPSMRIDLLERLPFPDVGELSANKIRRLVIEAETARICAAEAEGEAIRIIEEEVLPQWLA